MFVVCWTDEDNERWKIVYSENAVDKFISDLIDEGIEEGDIICGELLELF